ncbi:hypothetical protein BEL04_10860 [Mucilaginibacter sp. PPCGB 2223]|uniref:hypothetical protein n=1 Tax=Mucilaginibacter sp. PPCGB 2223 TaxID=1886027 RepID=UPI000824D9D8|nr:hypothetical protein [Mucilaginibacter sp. PPCGB 2223]OCX54716.1 hypothetical protein BEL04_10860 [Mucilaginibacter sp. PPCGB 2223]
MKPSFKTLKHALIVLLLLLGPLNLLAAATADTGAVIDPLTTLQGFKKTEISPMRQRYNDFVLKDRMWVYNWQDISSVIIFLMVIAVVIMGLILSYKQFAFTNQMILKHHEAMLASPPKQAVTKVTNSAAGTQIQQSGDADEQSTTKVKVEPAGDDIPQTATTFEVSKDGLKINSAVIGLIILVVSIVFFFLYLRFVYPIHEVHDTIQ